MQAMYRFIVMVDTFLFPKENVMKELAKILCSIKGYDGFKWVASDVVKCYIAGKFQAMWELDDSCNVWTAMRLDKNGDYLFLN
jgi:hypothetical protein